MLEKITDTFFAEKERWFSWISVLFGMGIGLYFGLSAEPSLWWTLGIIEIFILIVILYRKSEEKLLFLSIPAIVLAGFTYIQLDAAYIAKTPRLEGEEAIYVQGRISNVDYNSKQRQRITLEKMQNFAGEEIKGSYKITLMPYAAEKTDYHYSRKSGNILRDEPSSLRLWRDTENHCVPSQIRNAP